MAVQLGPIVMPCRVCYVAPGDPCTWARPSVMRNDQTRRKAGVDFHAIRIADAEAASALLAD